MSFSLLTKHEQHNAVVSHFAATELDVHLHTINAQRYETMLRSGSLSSKFATRIRELLSETKDRLAEVTAIMEATRSQLPEPHILRALMAARVAETVMQSGAPAERAAAFAACDPELSSTIMSVSHLASAAKKVA